LLLLLLLLAVVNYCCGEGRHCSRPGVALAHRGVEAELAARVGKEACHELLGALAEKVSHGAMLKVWLVVRLRLSRRRPCLLVQGLCLLLPRRVLLVTMLLLLVVFTMLLLPRWVLLMAMRLIRRWRVGGVGVCGRGGGEGRERGRREGAGEGRGG